MTQLSKTNYQTHETAVNNESINNSISSVQNGNFPNNTSPTRESSFIDEGNLSQTNAYMDWQPIENCFNGIITSQQETDLIPYPLTMIMSNHLIKLILFKIIATAIIIT